MNIIEFINQCHPETLDYIENDLMDKLITVDKLYKLQSATKSIREVFNETK